MPTTITVAISYKISASNAQSLLYQWQLVIGDKTTGKTSIFHVETTCFNT